MGAPEKFPEQSEKGSMVPGVALNIQRSKVKFARQRVCSTRNRESSAHPQADGEGGGHGRVERHMGYPPWVSPSEEEAWFLPTSPFLLPPQTPHPSSTHKDSPPQPHPQRLIHPPTLLWRPYLHPSPVCIPKIQGMLPAWRQKRPQRGNFLFKPGRNKQMVLQSTGTALGWKFKMH